MQRIRSVSNPGGTDLFGEGRHGFADGDATIAQSPTHLNSQWFNNVQEEIARCVEGDGATLTNETSLAPLSTQNLHQLGDAVGHGSDAMFPRTEDARFVVEGLEIDVFDGLDVVLEPGRYVFDGRRYFVTAQKMIDAYPASGYRATLTFGGTPTNGDYVATWDGFGLGSPVDVTTTRTAGSPATNGGLAIEHESDTTGEAALVAVVGDADVVSESVEIIIAGGLAAGTIETEAPSGATFEAAFTGLHFSLDASRDHYFYIAPEDPSDLADPPDRATVHVERLDVANGASAPATPSGTLLFAVVVTDASSVLSIDYRNRGPAVIADNGAGLRLRPEPNSTRAALVPIDGEIDIGEELPAGATAPTVAGHVRYVNAKRIRLLSTAVADQDAVYVDNFTLQENVAGGAADDVALLNTSSFPDGSTFYVRAEGVAIDPSDPTDGFSFRTECHAHIDGTLQLDGTGGTPAPFRGGAGAIAASMDASFSISGSILRLRLTGHSADATRWLVEVKIIATGNTP